MLLRYRDAKVGVTNGRFYIPIGRPNGVGVIAVSYIQDMSGRKCRASFWTLTKILTESRRDIECILSPPIHYKSKIRVWTRGLEDNKDLQTVKNGRR